MVTRVAPVDWLTGLGSKYEVGCTFCTDGCTDCVLVSFAVFILILVVIVFSGIHLSPLSFEVGTSR